MKTYALIQNGTVFEVLPTDGTIADMFHPDLVWVDISAVNPMPVQGWTATENNGAWTFAAPVVPAPTLAEQAQAQLDGGCQITSASTPALNGTYACDPSAQSKIQATALYIQVNGKFPAGKASLPWADIKGAIHTFTSPAEFQAFATAIGDYVTELEMVLLGQAAALPVQPAIA